MSSYLVAYVGPSMHTFPFNSGTPPLNVSGLDVVLMLGHLCPLVHLDFACLVYCVIICVSCLEYDHLLLIVVLGGSTLVSLFLTMIIGNVINITINFNHPSILHFVCDVVWLE